MEKQISDYSLDELLDIARDARNQQKYSDAFTYYSHAFNRDNNNWEARFFYYYYSIIADISNVTAIQYIRKLSDNAHLIIQNLKDQCASDFNLNYIEFGVMSIADRVIYMVNSSLNSDFTLEQGVVSGKVFMFEIGRLYYSYGTAIESVFNNESSIKRYCIKMWKNSINTINAYLPIIKETDRVEEKKIINNAALKIKKYEPSYTVFIESYKGGASSGSDGCYVATAVYGTYNCPQLWVLRRYRDSILGRKWYGRAFIYSYYAISPKMVELFGDCKFFQKFFRKKLDCFVNKLESKGIKDTEYVDINWRKRKEK